MICYKDKVFCSNKKHSKDCDRQITEDQKKEADEMGLNIAYGSYCK